MNVVITESLQRTQGQLTPCLISMSLMQADCHKNRIVTKTQEAQEHKDEQSSNRPACPRKVPLPSESTIEPFGCHNIFRKAVFPLWPIVSFVTFTTPPPPRLPPPHTQGPEQFYHVPTNNCGMAAGLTCGGDELNPIPDYAVTGCMLYLEN